MQVDELGVYPSKQPPLPFEGTLLFSKPFLRVTRRGGVAAGKEKKCAQRKSIEKEDGKTKRQHIFHILIKASPLLGHFGAFR